METVHPPIEDVTNMYPQTGGLSAKEAIDFANIAEANLTPDQMGPMNVEYKEAPAATAWEDFRGEAVEITPPASKEVTRMSGNFSEAELSVAAMKREAMLKAQAEVEAKAGESVRNQLLRSAGGDVAKIDLTKDTLFSDSLISSNIDADEDSKVAA